MDPFRDVGWVIFLGFPSLGLHDAIAFRHFAKIIEIARAPDLNVILSMDNPLRSYEKCMVHLVDGRRI